MAGEAAVDCRAEVITFITCTARLKESRSIFSRSSVPPIHIIETEEALRLKSRWQVNRKSKACRQFTEGTSVIWPKPFVGEDQQPDAIRIAPGLLPWQRRRCRHP